MRFSYKQTLGYIQCDMGNTDAAENYRPKYRTEGHCCAPKTKWQKEINEVQFRTT